MSIGLLTAFGWQGLLLFVWVALCVGSFLNVVIYRLPVMMQREWEQQARAILELPEPPEQSRFNLSVPRSRCPHCGHIIRFYENIPVLSWLFLRGKCSQCANPISFRYPAIEILTAICSVAVLATYGFTWLGLSAVVCTWLLIALTFIDYDTKLLPDQLTYPILWMGLLTAWLSDGAIVTLPDALVGALAGYLSLWSVYWAFKLLTGKEGMGHGDFKLLAGLGAWMGWQALPNIILISALVGLAYAVIRIVFSKQSSAEPIPFGPFLSIAGWVTLIFRDNVLGLFLL